MGSKENKARRTSEAYRRLGSFETVGHPLLAPHHFSAMHRKCIAKNTTCIFFFTRGVACTTISFLSESPFRILVKRWYAMHLRLYIFDVKKKMRKYHRRVSRSVRRWKGDAPAVVHTCTVLCIFFFTSKMYNLRCIAFPDGTRCCFAPSEEDVKKNAGASGPHYSTRLLFDAHHRRDYITKIDFFHTFLLLKYYLLIIGQVC